MNSLIQFYHSKRSFRVLFFSCFIAFPCISSAEYGSGEFVSSMDTDSTSSQTSSGSSSTVNAINMLGQWMGFSMPTAPTQPVPYMNPTLTTPDLTDITDEYYGISSSYLTSATPLLVNLSTGSTVLPANAPYTSTYATSYNILNSILASPYNAWSTYTTPSASTISVIPNVDLPNMSNTSTYPCNTIGCEIVYSLVGTPDYTYCVPGYTSNTAFPYPPNSDNCAVLQYDLSVASNFLGVSSTETNGTMNYGTGFPAPGTITDYFQNQMPNINADILIGPLNYSSTQSNNVNNFLHNIVGSLIMSLPIPYSEYQTAYNNIQSANPSVAIPAAQALFEYILGLKSLGSMISVGLSDFEYIIGRRMTNPLTGTSSAYDESMMATRRLFNNSPTQGQVPTNTWINDMEQASPIVLQREQLYLLAEINYQLYLDRMQNERILLTLAAMQLGITLASTPSVSQPLSSLSSGNTSTSTTS